MIVTSTKQFKRDLEKIFQSSKSSVCDLIQERLGIFIDKKTNNSSLPPSFRDHALRNNKTFQNCRDCHLTGDTVLIYTVEQNKLILTMLKIGNHSNIFSSKEIPNTKLILEEIDTSKLLKQYEKKLNDIDRKIFKKYIKAFKRLGE